MDQIGYHNSYVSALMFADGIVSSVEFGMAILEMDPNAPLPPMQLDFMREFLCQTRNVGQDVLFNQTKGTHSLSWHEITDTGCDCSDHEIPVVVLSPVSSSSSSSVSSSSLQDDKHSSSPDQLNCEDNATFQCDDTVGIWQKSAVC